MRRDAFHEDKGERRLIPGHLAINNGGVLYQMSPRAASVQAARCPNKVSVDAAIAPHSNLRISQIVSLPVVFWTDSRCRVHGSGALLDDKNSKNSKNQFRARPIVAS
jgi:hypothetical protein